MQQRKLGILGFIQENLCGFLKNKPPVAILMIFILSLSLFLLVLSYYVLKNDIVDGEATQEYRQIVANLADLAFCISNTTNHVNHSEIKESQKSFNEADFVNVTFPLTASLQISSSKQVNIANITNFVGVVPYFLLLNNDDHHPSIIVYASLSKSWSPGKHKEDFTVNSCVTLRMKRDNLPDEIPKMRCSKYDSHVSTTLYMETLRRQKKKRALCIKGTQLNLGIDKYDANVYINEWEKLKINRRLHLASYIFFFIFLLFLIYAIVRGKPIDTVEHVKNSRDMKNAPYCIW